MTGNVSIASSATNATASNRKALREKFGVREAAIPAVTVFRKAMPFDHTTIQTNSWIIIRPDGRRTHANTYNGKLGKGADYETNTFDLPAAGTKEHRKVFKGYEEVTVDQCPIAVKADAINNAVGANVVNQTSELPTSDDEAGE